MALAHVQVAWVGRQREGVLLDAEIVLVYDPASFSGGTWGGCLGQDPDPPHSIVVLLKGRTSGHGARSSIYPPLQRCEDAQPVSQLLGHRTGFLHVADNAGRDQH